MNGTVELAVQAQHLTKRYKDLVAVDGIDFQIEAGVCFGMLGPNGAGKTTTVRMIYGAAPPTSGTLTVLGWDVVKNPREIKAQLGVCPQEVNLDPDFSVEKNLWVYGRYFGMSRSVMAERVEAMLRFAELSAKRNQKVDNLSGGMKRRLLMARALINSPRLLILDEPTTGLDPQARHMIWERIQELKRNGVTIILTTHYMEEAEFLCDRLMFIDHGKIIESGSPRALVASHSGREVLELWDLTAAQLQQLDAGPVPLEFSGTRAFHYGDTVAGAAAKILEMDPGLTKYMIRPANLEDVFLKLTGRGLRE